MTVYVPGYMHADYVCPCIYVLFHRAIVSFSSISVSGISYLYIFYDSLNSVCNTY